MRPLITAMAYDKRGRLVSVGMNSYVKTHPLQAKIAAEVGAPEKIYIHAELDALIKARGKAVYKLVVVRVDKKGRYVNAEPCHVCKRAIKIFNVKHIKHT
jgi:deoxycytidylate deaminase